MKDTYTKWLLTINDESELMITPKETSKNAPINRLLDQVGFYSFDWMTVNKTPYIIVYDPLEEHLVKTRVLVIKTYKHGRNEGIIDLDDSDKKNMGEIANLYLRS